MSPCSANRFSRRRALVSSPFHQWSAIWRWAEETYLLHQGLDDFGVAGVMWNASRHATAPGSSAVGGRRRLALRRLLPAPAGTAPKSGRPGVALWDRGDGGGRAAAGERPVRSIDDFHGLRRQVGRGQPGRPLSQGCGDVGLAVRLVSCGPGLRVGFAGRPGRSRGGPRRGN